MTKCLMDNGTAPHHRVRVWRNSSGGFPKPNETGGLVLAMSVGLPCGQAAGVPLRHLHGSGTEAKHGWDCPRRVSGKKGKDKTLGRPNFHEAGIGWKFLGSCPRAGKT